MARNIIEAIREEVMKDAFSNATFTRCWAVWKGSILTRLNNPIDAKSIIDLGDSLRAIFKSTRPEDGRGGQSGVSQAGTLWEFFAVWYLNVCFVGSRAVIVKKTSMLPKSIKDALTVYYDNLACSAEPDLTVLVFPDKEVFTGEPSSMLTPRSHKVDYDKVSEKVALHFELFQIGVIQCKSNWNENSQIPMLWDIVYNSGGIPSQNIMVGTETFNLKDLKAFKYSFFTMPSNDVDNYTPTRVEISRVRNLSGGNFWGCPTKNGIAKSIKEIFRHYDYAYDNTEGGNQKAILNAELPNFNTEFSYFNLL